MRAIELTALSNAALGKQTMMSVQLLLILQKFSDSVRKAPFGNFEDRDQDLLLGADLLVGYGQKTVLVSVSHKGFFRC